MAVNSPQQNIIRGGRFDVECGGPLSIEPTGRRVKMSAHLGAASRILMVGIILVVGIMIIVEPKLMDEILEDMVPFYDSSDSGDQSWFAGEDHP